MAYARTNDSNSADIYRKNLFAEGSFKYVWRGVYKEGARAGQDCVAKEFKTGRVFEDHYFDEELNVIRRTQSIINNWHDEGIITQRILLNTPAIWEYEDSRHKTLVEPLIQNFEKFNSNSGWTPNDGDVWAEAMQALSHFSYHNSGGQVVLCDLQGGSYRDGYILSDPVIMSQVQSYGPADLGPDGIRSFFQRHICGRFCRREWTRPRVIGRAAIPMRQGTTMTTVPMRRSRYPLSSLAE
ncbi:hypothetical protein M9X92_011842 [Pyricularia oryzae]|nr:hypothetical protein M9X92_011842 [Pyricularia oryzae]